MIYFTKILFLLKLGVYFNITIYNKQEFIYF